MSWQRTAIGAETPSEITFFPGEIESLVTREQLGRIALEPHHDVAGGLLRTMSACTAGRACRRSGSPTSSSSAMDSAMPCRRLPEVGPADLQPRLGRRVRRACRRLPLQRRRPGREAAAQLARLIGAESVTVLSGPQARTYPSPGVSLPAGRNLRVVAGRRAAGRAARAPADAPCSRSSGLF